jgi:hypothetical protein
MAKHAKVAAELVVAETNEGRELVVFQPTTPEQENADDAEIEEQEKLPASVVPGKYKTRYKDRARANGHRSKAAKRSTWDWLAQVLAAEVLNKQGKIDIDKLVAVLQANGLEDPLETWPNRSKGWEGRIRMTGGIWLRREVAEVGEMRLADGEVLTPPAEWVAKHTN